MLRTFFVLRRLFQLRHIFSFGGALAGLTRLPHCGLSQQRRPLIGLGNHEKAFSTRLTVVDPEVRTRPLLLVAWRTLFLCSQSLPLSWVLHCATISCASFQHFIPFLDGRSFCKSFSRECSALGERSVDAAVLPHPKYSTTHGFSLAACTSSTTTLSTGITPTTTLFHKTVPLLGYHYIHPKTSRPIRQFRKYGDPRYINNEVALIKGLFGLITTDFGMVTQAQMESARLAILRRIPRGAFSLVMHTDYEEFPVVKKSPESRMGAGKSNIHHFAYKLTTGIPLFEIYSTGGRRLNQAEAEGIFLAGRPFIPLQTAVVPRGRVDEYNVFR